MVQREGPSLHEYASEGQDHEPGFVGAGTGAERKMERPILRFMPLRSSSADCLIPIGLDARGTTKGAARR